MTATPFTRGDIPYPSGTIMLWKGSFEDIPSGWTLCDGENGTPDLIDRYFRSVPDSSTDPGYTGGENTKTLSEAQLPAHSHNGTAKEDGEHTHLYGRHTSRNVSDYYQIDHTGGPHDHTYNNTSYNTSAAGAHAHTFTSDEAGSGEPIDNRPLSDEFYPLMKT